MRLQDFFRAARGKKGITVVGPVTKATAMTMVQQWEDAKKDKMCMVAEAKQAATQSKTQTCHRERIDLTQKKILCIARMQDGSKCGRAYNVCITALGPLCGEHAILCREVFSEYRRKP